MATFKLFLFGAPRLEQDGTVIKISQRKALVLLAYLAATGKIHARDMLATLFWPDHSQSEAAGRSPQTLAGSPARAKRHRHMHPMSGAPRAREPLACIRPVPVRHRPSDGA